MIQLHSIRSRMDLRLADHQLFSIGEGLNRGETLRLRVGVRGTTVQYIPWWGSWSPFTAHRYIYDTRTQNRRIAAGQRAIDQNLIEISYTPTAEVRR